MPVIGYLGAESRERAQGFFGLSAAG